ncbi:DUF3558 domain-containing protein [Streptomyces fructofermentans]|uniref:DUF3558 domain-containing protein n=1 Tax=Streptomyces fructofermentans TaxID=152141 RepID=A0A918NQI9_9ACTN|nr:DUF3558 domain-containing protein [Streptomyces fructofermentans]GGX87287.1 hypothetical protein GCM10010515_63330 [Streptomyces fructofermentans]
MQRKAYVSGVAALLAVLLAGCTGGSPQDESPTDPKPGDTATTSAAAPPGKYRTLPEPCAAVSQNTLDALLPGIGQITDERQREKAYAGTATPTFDTDRKVGCRWKAEAASVTDHLLVDFERVVSYENAVSDDDEATRIFAGKVTAADLPEPSSSPEDSGDDDGSQPGSGSSDEPSAEGSQDEDEASPDGSDGPDSDASASGTASGEPGATSVPAALQPRVLDDLGDEAFLDDALNDSRQRTVTVVFRTSNVIVTIQYDEQPASTTDVPSSEDMQDRARKLADRLAGTFND